MKQKINYFILAVASVFISLTINFFYSRLAVSLSPGELRTYRETLNFGDSNRSTAHFDLSCDAYLLKIKGAPWKDYPPRIFFNGLEVDSTLHLSHTKRGSYIYLPKRIVNKGGNNLEIIFLRNHPPEAGVTLTNYYRNIKELDLFFPNSLYVLFPDSASLSRDRVTLKTVILSSIIVFLWLILTAAYLRKVSSLDIRRLFLYQLYSLVTLLSIWFLLLAIPQAINKAYRVAVAPELFFGIGFVAFLAVNLGILSKKDPGIFMRSVLFSRGFFSRNKIISIIVVFALYAAFVLLSLTKEPLVYYDEVFFANIARSLGNSQFDAPTPPFQRQFSVPSKLTFIMHPPLYRWLLSASFYFFGFNIYTLRLISFAIGLLLIFFFYFFLKRIIKDSALMPLILLILALDQAFLCASRMGRPDILAVFFITISLCFYLRTLEEDKTKNYFLSGLFSGLSFMVHFTLGFIPLGLTGMHFLLAKRWKRISPSKLFYLTTPALIFFILWLALSVLPLLSRNQGLFRDVVSLFKSKVNHGISYEQLEGFIRTDISYIYMLLLFPLIISLENKSGIKSFLLASYLFIYPYLFLVSGRYLSWYMPVACIAFIYLIREKKLKRLASMLLAAVISFNLITQLRLLRGGKNFSYDGYSRQLAGYLPVGAKVCIAKAYCDPYFWLAANRKDLKLEYIWSESPWPARMDPVRTADYVVVGKAIRDMNECGDPEVQFLSSYLLNHSQSSVPIHLDRFDLTIFKMGNNPLRQG